MTIDSGLRFISGFIGGVVTLPAFYKDFDLVHKTAAQKTAFASNVVSVFQVRRPVLGSSHR